MISVIICTYNRSGSLKNVLDSLLAQEGIDSLQHEIIIVDNNSKDDTADVVRSDAERFCGKLRYVFEPQQGINFARNRGIVESRGEILAFTDDDVIVDKYWVRNLVNNFNHFDFDAAGGRVLPSYPSRVPTWVIENKDVLSGPIVCHDYGDQIRPYDVTLCPFVGANIAIRKSALLEVGSFRTDIGLGVGTYGDDSEMFERLTKRDKKIFYCGNLLVWHPVDSSRTTYRYIAKWFFLSGKYYVQNEYPKYFNPGAVFLFGAPRYLYRDLLSNILQFFVRISNKGKSLKNWRNIFLILGMVDAYKRKIRVGAS